MQNFCLVDYNLRIKYVANQSKKSVKGNIWGSPMLSLYLWHFVEKFREQPECKLVL